VRIPANPLKYGHNRRIVLKSRRKAAKKIARSAKNF